MADAVRHKQPTSVGVALKERPTELQLCSFLGLFTGATQKKKISLKTSHRLEIMMTTFKKQQKFGCGVMVGRRHVEVQKCVCHKE